MISLETLSTTQLRLQLIAAFTEGQKLTEGQHKLLNTSLSIFSAVGLLLSELNCDVRNIYAVIGCNFVLGETRHTEGQ